MRQITLELHIGQKLLVYPNPTTHPVEVRVTGFDGVKGLVYVRPLAFAALWAVRPRAIANLRGLYLHWKDQTFFFSAEPFFA